MIGYLEGKLLKKEDDRVLVLANQVGYEVLLPVFVMETLQGKSAGDPVSFTIYYHQTERQPKPVLIGFHLEAEKEFFQQFISVEAIGPLKAVKALNMPVRDIARAIEAKDVQKLRNLKGIGERTAQKIVATLQGKMDKFAMIRKEEKDATPVNEDFTQPVFDVLVNQLGHKPLDARRMIEEAMKRDTRISSPEHLFDEVYRGEKNK
jgi:holliday junction DNA helicase RuvA